VGPPSILLNRFDAVGNFRCGYLFVLLGQPERRRSALGPIRRSMDSRNPRTGVQVAVEQKRVLFFKAGKEMRERLNQH
jgi:hypothetical protein